MSIDAIRSDIYNAIRDIPDIGIVHDYDRFTNVLDDFEDRYKTNIDGHDMIRAWDVSFEDMTPIPPTEFFPRHMRAFTFVVRGYYTIYDDDESEKVAAELAEDVCNALDNDSELTDKTKYYLDPTDRLAKIRTFVSLVFGGFLCHYIEIETTVTEFIT